MVINNFNSKLQHILTELDILFNKEKYYGYDPYDGLNTNNYVSNLFKKNAIGRLILIQANKRSIFNLRPLFGIKKGLNPKTLALIISGRCVRDNLADASQIVSILQDFLSTQNSGGWGYYFDWQSRVFFQPGNTPTIVATSFVCNALMDLYVRTKDENLLTMVREAMLFYKKDLNVYEDDNGICFSYSPLDQSIIYNASALGLETIVRFQKLTGDSIFSNSFIEKNVNFLIKEQNDDGSWYYGKKPIQHFIDHYHTAYILESLENIRIYINDRFALVESIKKGIDFYTKNMFTEEGIPRFYKNNMYPVESHCAGAAIKALCVLSHNHGNHLYDLAKKVANWTISNIYDNKKGYFYYQKQRFYTNKINYLRWSQAWMYAGLSYLLAAGKKYANS